MEKFATKLHLRRLRTIGIFSWQALYNRVAHQLYFGAIGIAVRAVSRGRRELAFWVDAADAGLVYFKDVGIGKMPAFHTIDFTP